MTCPPTCDAAVRALKKEIPGNADWHFRKTAAANGGVLTAAAEGGCARRRCALSRRRSPPSFAAVVRRRRSSPLSAAAVFLRIPEIPRRTPKKTRQADWFGLPRRRVLSGDGL